MIFENLEIALTLFGQSENFQKFITNRPLKHVSTSTNATEIGCVKYQNFTKLSGVQIRCNFCILCIVGTYL